MGFLERFFRKYRAEDELKAEIKGGIVTPKITPTEVRPTEDRLMSRISTMTKQIEKLIRLGAPQETIDHWMDRKEKTKAMLWIFYDKDSKE